MGIEPTSSAWEAEVLPLNNTRSGGTASLRAESRLSKGEARGRPRLCRIDPRGLVSACTLMEVELNGEPRQLPPGTTAAGLVELLELAGKRLAMEVNGEIVPRSTFSRHTLRDGDQVEIVKAVGGG